MLSVVFFFIFLKKYAKCIVSIQLLLIFYLIVKIFWTSDEAQHSVGPPLDPNVLANVIICLQNSLQACKELKNTCFLSKIKCMHFISTTNNAQSTHIAYCYLADNR